MHTRITMASLAAILLTSLSTREADSQILAVDSEAGSTYAVPDLLSFPSNATYGWRFTVGSTPLYVTGLGFFDKQQDGLTTSYQVGIWDTSGSLLTSATIQAGTGSSLVGEFRFELVSATQLNANTTYVIGGYSPIGGDGAIMGLPAQRYSSDITYLGSSYDGGANSFAAPTTGYGGAHGAFGPNFEYSYSAVPEPATYALFTGLGLMGFVALRKRFAKN